MNKRPILRDIRLASQKLINYAYKTPVIESPRLNDLLKCRVLIKAENLQRTGSFKFRGAYNMISNLSEKQKKNGVVAFSSGNHAQGVAAAAKIHNLKACIVMPSDAPKIKIENTRNYGADVVLYNRCNANRVEIANKIIEKSGATLVHPYDDYEIITGQATVGMEFIEQTGQRNIDLDLLLVPCSGGGLISGNAITFDKLSPKTSLYSVEPSGFDDTRRSLNTGKRLKNKAGLNSFCDALLLETPGKLTFEINKQLLTGGLAVTDNETAKAIRIAFEEFKIVLEPGGAVGLAAVLSQAIHTVNKTVGVICTGGNIDANTFSSILSSK